MTRLLLVDDEPDIVRSLLLGLRSRGFEVDGYTDPSGAVQNFKPRTYELALLDVDMPIMPGGMVAEGLRNIDPKIVICFITAFDPGTVLFREKFPRATTFQNSFFILKRVGMDAIVSGVEHMLRPLPMSPLRSVRPYPPDPEAGTASAPHSSPGKAGSPIATRVKAHFQT